MSKPKKKVMLVCGSGIVSSTLIAPVIEEILEKSPYLCELIKGRIHEIPQRLKDLDLILTTVPLRGIDVGKVPVVVVTGLFAGRREEVEKQILEALSRS